MYDIMSLQNSIAFATFAKVDATGTFDVRVGFGSDCETECGSEWAAYVGGWAIRFKVKGDVIE